MVFEVVGKMDSEIMSSWHALDVREIKFEEVGLWLAWPV